MLVDEDEFCFDSFDTSYGYAPKWSRNISQRADEQNEVGDVDLFVPKPAGSSQENSTTRAEFASTSFLRTDVSSVSPKSFAIETVVRAKCSKEAVLLTEQLGTSPLEVEKLSNKFSEKDGTLLATQLNRELTDEWNSTSLFSGLGADHAGLEMLCTDHLLLMENTFRTPGSFQEEKKLVFARVVLKFSEHHHRIVGDSLLQTYDLLCNINLHLLVMQRELLKHENNIRELCNKDEVTAASFADGGNKKQLFRLLQSLGTASTSLRDRVASLNCTVMGVPFRSTRNSSPTSTFPFLICGIGVFLGIFLCRHHFIRFA